MGKSKIHTKFMVGNQKGRSGRRYEDNIETHPNINTIGECVVDSVGSG
jgi:hypothetical protein